MADFADRSLGIGYPGGTALLFGLVVVSLLAWRFAVGTVSVNNITTAKAEIFYWVTILFSNTLGTALGDWTSEGTGFGGGVFLFMGLIAVVAGLYFFTNISRTLLFWTAFILTRPLGATLGDLLTKSHADGGLNLSRFVSTGVIAVFMIGCILLIPQRAGAIQGSRSEDITCPAVSNGETAANCLALKAQEFGLLVQTESLFPHLVNTEYHLTMRGNTHGI